MNNLCHDVKVVDNQRTELINLSYQCYTNC